MAKVQRKVVKRRKQQSLSTGMILVILGVAVIAVAVLAFVLWPKPKVMVASDPQGLAACGSVPCPTKGDPNAPVKMVDVSSFSCSHCKDYSLTVEPQIEDKYIKTGKVYYIAHPLGFDAQSQAVAAAALCANDQGKYWEYSAMLFNNQGRLDMNSLALDAQQLGMDVSTFTACVGSGKHANDAKNSTDAARAAGVDATPSFFVNGKLVIKGALPFAEFQARIEEALAASN